MMARLNFLGAMSTVGASGTLLETGNERIVLDYGTKVTEGPMKFPLQIQGRVNAVVLSHAHLDHSGAIPVFTANGNGCPVYGVEPTKELVRLLLEDSIKISHEEGTTLPFSKNDVKKTIKAFHPQTYRKPFKINGTKVTLFDAGHIPGSALIHLDFGKTLLYTGDFNLLDTRLMEKCDMDIPETDCLVIESTYSDREHPDRKTQEQELVRIVRETIAKNGICLISGFAIGRLQEVLLILDKYGIDFPVYLDGMAKKAATIINKYPQLLHDPKSMDKALKKVKYVTTDSMRRKIISQPSVILTTSGMLSGGPIMYYLRHLHNDRRASLILTGFQTENTPGRILMETGRIVTEELDIEVEMLVKRLDFSAHSGRKELFEFVKHVNPQKIFCMHGDHTEEFAEELVQKGFDAVAPVANERVFEI
jgi:putative mRNA 3-end processing factor